MNGYLEVGDVVTFDYENTRWRQNEHNPVGVTGIVTEADSSIIVEWSTGTWNAYSPGDEDLILIAEKAK